MAIPDAQSQSPIDLFLLSYNITWNVNYKIVMKNKSDGCILHCSKTANTHNFSIFIIGVLCSSLGVSCYFMCACS